MTQSEAYTGFMFLW